MGRRAKSRRVPRALGAAVGALALLAPAAAADTTISEPGEGAGQTSSPQGLAIDADAGRLYVADQGNNRIEVFDAETQAFLFAFGWNVNAEAPAEEPQLCDEATGCQKGSSGAGAGQLGAPDSVAVDNDPLSSSYHDLYVVARGADSAHRRVERFDDEGNFLGAFGEAEIPLSPGGARNGAMLVAVGREGEVLVADNPEPVLIRLREYEPGGGAPLREAQPEAATGNLVGLAVDSAGDIHIRGKPADESLCKYDAATWEAIFCFERRDAEGVVAVAVDPADRLFAGGLDAKQNSLGQYRVIAEYPPSGPPALRRFGYGMFSSANDLSEGFVDGLAYHPGAEGDVYASNGDLVRYLSFPPPGPLVAPEACGAGEVRSTKATLQAEVNPQGKATGYHFEVVDAATFAESGFAEATRFPAEAAEDPVLDADPALHGANVAVSGLAPETEYRCRVVAENAEGEAVGEEGSFETLEPLLFGAVWSSGVSSDAATLHGEVNPLGSAATGYFEYVEEETCRADEESAEANPAAHCFDHAKEVPDVVGGEAPLDFGEGEEMLAHAAGLGSLPSGTAFRYRLLAKDHCKPDPEIVCTFASPEAAFATFAVPAPLPSPDPCPNAAYRTGPASFLPDCRAYELVSPVDKNNADVQQVRVDGREGLNQSAVSGGRLTFTASQSFADPEGAPGANQYLSSRRAGEGWSTVAIDPPQGFSVVPTTVGLVPKYKAFSPELCRGWFRDDTSLALTRTAPEGFATIYRRELCPRGGYEAITTVTPPEAEPLDYLPQLQALSADGELAVYRAPDGLSEEDAAPCCAYQVYGRGTGESKPRLLSVLPDGSPSALRNSAGTASGRGPVSSLTGYEDSVRNALAADGSRLYWTASTRSLAHETGTIYVRDNTMQPQSNVAGGHCTQAARACTYPVSGLVSSAEAQFWAASRSGSAALFTVGGGLYRFEFEADAEEGGTPVQIAGEVAGLLGTSEDLSRVYLVSREVCSSEPNSEGDSADPEAPNLYLYESGESCAEGDFAFLATLSEEDAIDQTQGARSPFSENPNKRTARVNPDGGVLAFMSTASPTGYDNTDLASGRPNAEVYLYEAATGELRCASCNPSGQRPSGRQLESVPNNHPPLWFAAQIPTWATELYAGRPLSDDGARLYFESTEALVARDTNGRMDVYQWEALGTGPGEARCATASPSYSKSAGGCVDLISSGQSPRDSGFLDASADGRDVFILTASDLLSQDEGLTDIYDARQGGGLPEPPSPRPECEGEACQNPPAAPPAPTPSSTAFAGPGNLPQGRSCTRPARKAKRLGRRARRLRRHAKHSRKSAKAKAMRGKAKRFARRAHRLSKRAKRCRARQRGRGRGR